MKSKIIKLLRTVFRFFAPLIYFYIFKLIGDSHLIINGYDLSIINKIIAALMIYIPICSFTNSIIDNTSISIKKDDEEWEDDEDNIK